MSSTDAPPLTAEAIATLVASLRPVDRRVPVMSPLDFAALRAEVKPPPSPFLEFGLVIQTNNHLRRGEVYLVPPESWKWIRDLAPKAQAEALRFASMTTGPDEQILAEWAAVDPLSGGE